jgi:cellulose synthase (UDP-forming)
MNEKIRIFILRITIVGGFLALGYYYSWWFQHGNLSSHWQVFWLMAAILYAGVQLVANWLLYWIARRPLAPPVLNEDMSVDVFITAYHEPIEMVKRSLQAACGMSGKHDTWLLDDGADPALAALAEFLGAGYLTRSDSTNAKAGNLNAALAHTSGDIIAIFDVDHVPNLDYLERTTGYFRNPRMGFVQVMLTFSNSGDTWVAKAAAETSLDYYNPTSLGADGIGGATLMGSNALIRRKALESIGGYQPGLAEDLATSLALHAAGWQSAYVAEPLAPGLAPPDLAAWFTQQLKWARGVFELLLTDYPRLFQRLTWGQRLSYAVRMTKYWIGPAVFLHLFATIAILIFGGSYIRGIFHEYLLHITPLVIMDVLIRFVALRAYRHESTPSTSLVRAVTLVYATWPIYLTAWVMSILRLPLGFRPTPKNVSGGLNPLWLLPQILAVGFLIFGILYTVLVIGHPVSLLLAFAIIQGILQLLLLARWLHLEFTVRKKVPSYVAEVK